MLVFWIEDDKELILEKKLRRKSKMTILGLANQHFKGFD